jgi:hypothetical protein
MDWINGGLTDSIVTLIRTAKYYTQHSSNMVVSKIKLTCNQTQNETETTSLLFYYK